MISREREELLKILAELSEVAPEVRLGQLVANLSYMRGSFDGVDLGHGG